MISLIIPAYNEADGLRAAIQSVLTHFPASHHLELLFVDDGSTDGSWKAIQALRQAHPFVSALRLSRNFGKEAALMAGLAACQGQAAIIMDADMQHPPSLLPAMIQAWEAGAEVVEGVKEARGDESFVSRFFAKNFYRLFRLASGLDLQNASDFRLLDRKVIDALLACQEQDPFFRGLSSWVGFERVQLPFEVAERQTGESRWSFGALLRLGLDALTSFSARPLHAIAWLGLLLLLGSLPLGLQTLVNWASGQAASGFTTVILLLLLIGGALMMALALIGLYLARIYQEVKARPRYLVSAQLSGRPQPGLGKMLSSLSDYQAKASVSQGWSPRQKALGDRLAQHMQEGGVDFHLHSSASDGSDSPLELFAAVKAAKLRAFALTDHDQMAGILPIQEALASEGHGPDFIPGIECSVDFEGQTLHLLGYFDSPEAVPAMQAFLEARRQSRQKRNSALVARLQADGHAVSMEALQAIAGQQAGQAPPMISRLHVAQWMQKQGLVSTVQEAFERFLNEGRPYFVFRDNPSLESALKAIHEAQGLGFIAHPQHYGWLEDPRLLSDKLSRLRAQGLDGVEVFHGAASSDERRLLFEVSSRLGLAKIGGSDYHGVHKALVPLYTEKTQFIESL